MTYCSGCNTRHDTSECPFRPDTASHDVSDWVREALADRLSEQAKD